MGWSWTTAEGLGFQDAPKMMEELAAALYEREEAMGCPHQLFHTADPAVIKSLPTADELVFQYPLNQTAWWNPILLFDSDIERFFKELKEGIQGLLAGASWNYYWSTHIMKDPDDSVVWDWDSMSVDEFDLGFASPECEAPRRAEVWDWYRSALNAIKYIIWHFSVTADPPAYYNYYRVNSGSGPINWQELWNATRFSSSQAPIQATPYLSLSVEGTRFSDRFGSLDYQYYGSWIVQRTGHLYESIGGPVEIFKGEHVKGQVALVAYSSWSWLNPPDEYGPVTWEATVTGACGMTVPIGPIGLAPGVVMHYQEGPWNWKVSQEVAISWDVLTNDDPPCGPPPEVPALWDMSTSRMSMSVRLLGGAVVPGGQIQYVDKPNSHEITDVSGEFEYHG